MLNGPHPSDPGPALRCANVQYVAVDIEKSTQRRPAHLASVIQVFENDVEQQVDRLLGGPARRGEIMWSGTGDGLVLGLPFDGVPDLHLAVALRLLEVADHRRGNRRCRHFAAAGWCDCHPYYNLRVGIGEGKSVVRPSTDGRPVFTSSEIGMATRVMNAVDPNQIGFTERAHLAYVEVAPDTAVRRRFRTYRDVLVKHGETIDLFQYVGRGEPGLDRSWIRALRPPA